ncbi:MAG: hypothetical protein OK456_07495 [Thaumarchaeota archaeon]|nr:hypothetical protein [Nitrososphaerota archaeon]
MKPAGRSYVLESIPQPLLSFLFAVYPESRGILRYRRVFGRLPKVIRPKTLNEKILHKMLFDRNPQMTIFADKFLVRAFVRSRLGDERCLTRLYGVVTSPKEIRSLSLPAQFVMKANHGSGWVKMVRDAKGLDDGELESLAALWLGQNFYDRYQEWAYKNIKPLVLFEELLNPEGKIPEDYKFYCFKGEPRFLNIDRERFVKHSRNYYDLGLSLLPVRHFKYENFVEQVSPPQNFDRMLEVSRRLSAGADFLRVDLYNVAGRVVFGELTNYPDHAMQRLLPPEWDLKFGNHWK